MAKKIISYDNLATFKEEYDKLLEGALSGKQDVISDLATIRSGAAAGATAYQKPVSGIPSTDIADGVIPDVSNFITKSVNDLVNYYTKSQTYTQTEVNNLIAAINQFSYLVVAELPVASADTMYKIYLVPSSDPQQGNVKDEYITIRSGEEGSYTYAFEQIGSTAIDLSGYYTSTQTDTLLAGKEWKFPVLTATSFNVDNGSVSISSTERQKLYTYISEHGEFAPAFVLKFTLYGENASAVFVLQDGHEDSTVEPPYGPGYVMSYYCVCHNEEWSNIAVITLHFSAGFGLSSSFQLIPKNLSQLTDDATHRLVTDTEKATWNAKADASTVYTKTQTDTMLGKKQNIYTDTATEDVTNPQEGDVCITAFTELGDYTTQTMYQVPVGVTLRIDPVAGETPSGNLYIMGHPTMMMVDLSTAELPIVTTNEGPMAWTILRMGMTTGVTIKQVGPPVRYEYYNGTWLNRDNTAQSLPAMQGTYTGRLVDGQRDYGVTNPKVGDISIFPKTDVLTDIQDETTLTVASSYLGARMQITCDSTTAQNPGAGTHDKPITGLVIKTSSTMTVQQMMKIRWSQQWTVVDYDDQEQPIYGWEYSMPYVVGNDDEETYYSYTFDFNAMLYSWFLSDVEWAFIMGNKTYTVEEFIEDEVAQHYEDEGIDNYETISIRDLIDIKLVMPESAYEYQADKNQTTGELSKGWYGYAKFGENEAAVLNALPTPTQLNALFEQKVDKVTGMSLTHNDWWGWRKEQIDDIVKDLYTDEVINTNGSWHSISLWQPYENTYTWQAWGLSDWQTAHATEIAHGDYANLWRMDFVFERFDLTIDTLPNQINSINVLTHNPAYGEPGELPYHEFPITDLMVEQFEPGDPYSQHTVYFYTTEKLYGFLLKTTYNFEPIEDETAFTYLLYAQRRTYALASNVPKFVEITASDYANLQVKDPNTLYIIVEQQ